MIFLDKFLTELLNLPLTNKNGKEIGVLEDIAIDPSETFPKVIGLIKRKDNKITLIQPEKIREVLKEKIVLEEPFEEQKISTREEKIFLKKDLLDKQIVDTDGIKVVRVNDIKIKSVGNDLRVVAVDIGATGILRRLKLDFLLTFFSKKNKEKLISFNFVEPLGKGFQNLRLNISRTKFANLHPSDVAQIISQVPFEEKLAIFESLKINLASEALHELEPEVQKNLIENLKPYQAANILENMPPDEASDVLGDVSEEKRQELLALMRPKEALAVKKLLQHEDNTAGGLMTTNFITLSENMTAEQVINKLREIAPNAESIYYLYVVDENDRLKGVLSLRRLVVSPPQTVIKDVIDTHLITVKAEANQKEVADLISKYNLLALPVVDNEGRILGIITVDDIVDIILPPASRRKRSLIG